MNVPRFHSLFISRTKRFHKLFFAYISFSIEPIVSRGDTTLQPIGNRSDEEDVEKTATGLKSQYLLNTDFRSTFKIGFPIEKTMRLAFFLQLPQYNERNGEKKLQTLKGDLAYVDSPWL